MALLQRELDPGIPEPAKQMEDQDILRMTLMAVRQMEEKGMQADPRYQQLLTIANNVKQRIFYASSTLKHPVDV